MNAGLSDLAQHLAKVRDDLVTMQALCIDLDDAGSACISGIGIVAEGSQNDHMETAVLSIARSQQALEEVTAALLIASTELAAYITENGLG